ncbi:MAG TPA: hypothetical protein VGM59_04425 [Dongiaceae bacterium]|jgi:hypothetical protein
MLEWMLDGFGVVVLVGQAAFFLALGDIEAPHPRPSQRGGPGSSVPDLQGHGRFGASR